MFAGGDVYFWDRDFGASLHHVKAPAHCGDLTSLTWRPGSDTFMFAAGYHDGAIRVWSAKEEENQAADMSEESVGADPSQK